LGQSGAEEGRGDNAGTRGARSPCAPGGKIGGWGSRHDDIGGCRTTGAASSRDAGTLTEDCLRRVRGSVRDPG